MPAMTVQVQVRESKREREREGFSVIYCLLYMPNILFTIFKEDRHTWCFFDVFFDLILKEIIGSTILFSCWVFCNEKNDFTVERIEYSSEYQFNIKHMWSKSKRRENWHHLFIDLLTRCSSSAIKFLHVRLERMQQIFLNVSQIYWHWNLIMTLLKSSPQTVSFYQIYL